MMNTETTTPSFNRSQSKSPEPSPNVCSSKNEIPASPNAPEPSPNVCFYKNEISASPNEECIEEILKWHGNYTELEYNHSYIQWLFPNREVGMNSWACVLTDEEAEIISRSEDLRGKVKKAFEMMLDFYGMRLTKNNQFELAENSEERLAKLNKWTNHNFLRITRILLALKELGHNELTLPWMKFLADLIYKENKLYWAQSSFEKFWINTLDADDKLKLIEYQNTLLRNRDASKSSKDTSKSFKDTIPSTRTDNKECYSDESLDITKSNEDLVSSIDTDSSVSTSPNDNIENSTANSSTIPTDAMSSAPASDTQKPIEAKAMADVGTKSTRTTIPAVNEENTPTFIGKHLSNFKSSFNQFS